MIYFYIYKVKGGFKLTSQKKKKLDKLFTTFCETYHPKVFKYLYFATSNEVVAKDLTQDTFMIIYDKMEQLETHPNPGGFIFQTAKYTLANYKRQLHKKASYESILEAAILPSVPDAASALAYDLDMHINEDLYIEEALSCLTDEKRLLYQLHYIEGLNYKEIAQRLNIHEVTLRMKYVRLRREVQKNIHHIALTHFDQLGGI